jgi:hypothetical protein
MGNILSKETAVGVLMALAMLGAVRYFTGSNAGV